MLPSHTLSRVIGPSATVRAVSDAATSICETHFSVQHCHTQHFVAVPHAQCSPTYRTSVERPLVHASTRAVPHYAARSTATRRLAMALSRLTSLLGEGSISISRLLRRHQKNAVSWKANRVAWEEPLAWGFVAEDAVVKKVQTW